VTLTLVEAALLVNVSEHTIRQWVKRGHLRPVRPGGRPSRFLERDVVECHFKRTSRARHDELDAIWAEVLALSA
jgi:excisionase family DNA binding protein